MAQFSTSSESTYYDILHLSSGENLKQLSKQELKQAYHRALLLHHPDKSNGAQKLIPTAQTDGKGNIYTIDEITIAYKTLSDLTLRAEYDKQLRLLPQQKQTAVTERAFHTGLETVDLDDMEYDDATVMWFRSCRCGDMKGFQITETDLEKASDDGEILTGCKGCSLWLRVLFALSE